MIEISEVNRLAGEKGVSSGMIERGLAHQIDKLPDFDVTISECEQLTKTFFKKNR